jgi:hypothetical protein
MAVWIDELAQALGVQALSSEETRALLDAARDVAHRVERRVTPLSAFLLGAAVGRAEADGTPHDRAFAEALASLAETLPTPDSP